MSNNSLGYLIDFLKLSVEGADEEDGAAAASEVSGGLKASIMSLVEAYPTALAASFSTGPPPLSASRASSGPPTRGERAPVPRRESAGHAGPRSLEQMMDAARDVAMHEFVNEFGSRAERHSR